MPATLDDAHTLAELNAHIVACRRCPRLVAYREKIAREKKPMYRDEEYWGKPVPGWGDPHAQLYIVGLAPAAHGGNRTGRVFTGDSSGDFLYAALYRAGLANQPFSRSRTDGLQLHNVYIGAAARCAPPDNKPTPREMENCFPYLARELALLPNVRVLLALGQIAFHAALRALEANGVPIPRPRPQFGHGVIYRLGHSRPLTQGLKRQVGDPSVLGVKVRDYTLIGTYHPSRQNTNTGRLTATMFDQVLEIARKEVRQP